MALSGSDATTGDPGVDRPEPAADPTDGVAWRDRPLVVGIVVLVAVVTPWIVALLAFNRPRWYPIADLAQTELRVRDVGGGHPPLVGLAGRIGPWYDPGSHPGPLSFWALAPVYRLLGSSAAALSASSMALHASAAAVALWLANRRGGIRMIVAVGAAISLVAGAYGAVVQLEPWNPFLPTTWWLVFLLAAWSVLDDDTPVLVVAVAAGSFCAQTHLPYLGLVGALGGLLAVVTGWRFLRARDEPPSARRRRLVWLGVAVLVGVVLWIPPVIDEATGVGNLTRVRESLSEPEGEPVGLVRGAKEVVERFDPTRWLSPVDATGTPRPSDANPLGALVLVAWAAAAARALVAERRRRPSLVRLHVVLGAAIGLAVVAASRIHGELWSYLYLWLTGLAALMLLATGWTLAALVGERVDDDRRRRIGPVATTLAAVVIGVGTVVGVARAPDAEPSQPELSAELGVIARQTEAALRSGAAPGGGEDGRYLVRWDDPFTIGSRGFGMLNELERDGFDVGIEAGFRVGGTRHRVLDPDDATAVVLVAVGEARIDSWRDRPDDEALEVAFVEPRTVAERAAADALASRIDDRLGEEGLDERAARWREGAFTDSLDPALPADVRADLTRYVALGAPVAVFVVDPALVEG